MFALPLSRTCCCVRVGRATPLRHLTKPRGYVAGNTFASTVHRESLAHLPRARAQCRKHCSSAGLLYARAEEPNKASRPETGTPGALPPAARKLPPDVVEEVVTEQRVRFAEQVGSRKMAIAFTCARCETRIRKRFSRQAYCHGIVIITCPGCQVRHLIADNIGWFKDVPRSPGRAGYHIDDFAQVERVSAEVFELEESFSRSEETTHEALPDD